MLITLIACVDKNMGIGNDNNDLLYKLPDDLSNFKKVTSDKTVVMGRKTWESLPVQPLPNRRNIVLTTDELYRARGAMVVNSIEEILDLDEEHIYIIGGGNLYEQMIKYAYQLIITHVNDVSENAEVFFPEIDLEEKWAIAHVKDHKSDDKHEYEFSIVNYMRIK